MIAKIDKNQNRAKRHRRIRNKISGTASVPRFCVYRSLNHIYVQIIDDEARNTLISCSTMDKKLKGKADKLSKKEASKLVGVEAGKSALAKGIKEVVFDRGGYLYTGRIQSVAEGAREAGLKF